MRNYGAIRDYELPVKENRCWSGIIARLRLDPANQSEVKVEIPHVLLK